MAISSKIGSKRSGVELPMARPVSPDTVPDSSDRSVDEPSIIIDDALLDPLTGETLPDAQRASPSKRSTPKALEPRRTTELEIPEEDEAPSRDTLSHIPGVRRVRAFLHRHGRKLWWLHSAYAMMLGAFIVTFAQKGFRHARWLTLSLVAVWLITVILFRVVGSGADQKLESSKEKLRFLVITYVLKNLYQGMLFFLLPFYWKTATFSAPNRWFVVFLGVCTLVATLDLVFDRVLMRWRSVASVYFVITLFAVMNLAIPAIYPMPALWSLLLAAAVATASYWTLHVSPRLLHQPRVLGGLACSVAVAVAVAYVGRPLVPPVPLTVMDAAVGPQTLEDGRLALKVTELHHSLMKEMVAVTDVMSLSGAGETFTHVWRREGEEVRRIEILDAKPVEKSRVRLRSHLRGTQLPEERPGQWSLDIETGDGQLVGRFNFTVTD
ncbi:MAG: DUF5924 family protein [Bradymonadia bacterium]